ncbi:carboxyltransferase domain-containing protein [Gordonia caeni]|uniref:Allophanate hydrolase subunit 1 n=1 Tax=Gordonia caeni TaxID=1007097 RepID=A0ABP7PNR1_9ACTN
MRELPAGDDAVVLDFSATSDPAAAALTAAHRLRAAAAAGELAVGDVVPTAHAVLVQAEPGTGLDVLAVRRVLHRPHPAPVGTGAGDGRETQIPVHYDGADLRAVADHAGLTPQDVIDAHTAVSWRVQFMGFAPGFGYLVPESGPAQARAVFTALGRRAQSRPAVPPGAVAAAAGYSAVYPRTSPGGWFLLGHTDIEMWNVADEPPARLSAGDVVRFTCVD